MYEKFAIITKISHRAKCDFTCVSGPWDLIMIPNMKKIYPANMEECVRMSIPADKWLDGQMDWTLFYIS